MSPNYYIMFRISNDNVEGAAHGREKPTGETNHLNRYETLLSAALFSAKKLYRTKSRQTK